MSTFATGKHAYGFCDRCSFRYPLHELKEQIIDQKPSGLRVCPICMDIDHEQLQLGKFKIDDPEALQSPRPDINRTQSTGIFGWNPVGDNITMQMTAEVGSVTVS